MAIRLSVKKLRLILLHSLADMVMLMNRLRRDLGFTVSWILIPLIKEICYASALSKLSPNQSRNHKG